MSEARVPDLHRPVMPAETLRLLALQPGETAVDGTTGDGGHTALLARAVGPSGLVIAVDRDPAMLDRARARLAGQPVVFATGNYSRLDAILRDVGRDAVDGILLDLGVASPHLDDPSRGFGYRADGPLDMRMTPGEGPSALEWIARTPEEEMARAIRTYGEERFARRIARAIARQRACAAIRTTGELAGVVARAVPASPRRLHPARRTFQAIRIVVNDEIAHLERFLDRLPALLRPGGRCVVITYHSLEDRPVKRAFLAGAQRGDFERLTRKPLRPSEEESGDNPRSRSAKVRAVRRVAEGPRP